MGKRGKYGLGRVFQPKYKAKDGTIKTVNTWYIQYYDERGEQHRDPTSAKSEREARGFLADKLGQAHRGETPAGDKSLAYSDIREDLLRYYRVGKMASLETLKDGTETVKGLTKLDEYFGFGDDKKGMKVSQFNTADWDDNFITKRRREGVSDATIINSAKLLGKMFSLAVDNGRLSKAPEVTVPSAPPPRKDYLSKEQFDALFGKQGMPEQFHALLTFLFYQGVRIGEALSITWDQLDLDNGVFHPNAQNNKTGNTDPKPLQKQTVLALRKSTKNGDVVFTEARSEGDNPAKKFEKAFRAAMLRLGFGKPAWRCEQCKTVKDDAAPVGDAPALECPKCPETPMQYKYIGPSPHCLRASTVVYYREGGLSDAEIMTITGHDSSRSFKGYSRTRIENVKDRMDAAEAQRKKRAA
jgi:integrase